MKIFKTFRFESAHFLPFVPEGHKCGRLHGHSFEVEIHVRGEVKEKEGWVMDFADIKSAFKPLMVSLDHRLLNDVEGLHNPTSENLALWIQSKLRERLPELSKIVVKETCTSGCELDLEEK
jgi:6-pyruvoyltetrahydropterin/6-carboxytetrahydropterin synthase